jgi:hypothetical protein
VRGRLTKDQTDVGEGVGRREESEQRHYEARPDRAEGRPIVHGFL